MRGIIIMSVLFLSTASYSETSEECKGVTKKQMREFISTALSDPTGGYDAASNGCFVRADEMGRILARAGVPKACTQKIVITPPPGANTNWGYHIAVVVMGKKGKWWVIDPLASKEPMTPDQWKTRFSSGNPEYQIKYVSIDTYYGTNDSVRIDPYNPNSASQPDAARGVRFRDELRAGHKPEVAWERSAASYAPSSRAEPTAVPTFPPRATPRPHNNPDIYPASYRTHDY